ncbi:MAG: hypothetical protein KAJ19_22075 [Gammaproteobacteria bacterium]|nr:hypothetical protein [Gammaproteobacteria bacterium]
MTAEQMKYEFDVGYDKITNFDAPGYEPREISTFLTRAQESLVYEILNSSAFDEKNKKALSRLRQVIPLTTFSAGNYPNGFRTPLQVSVGGTDLLFVVAGNTILDTQGRFITAGFRVGDQILVTNAHTANNDGLHRIKTVHPTGAYIELFTTIGTDEIGDANTTITVDPILRVRNERSDIALGTTNFYYDRISGNAITDVEVDPIDDDFYSANKENPYKKSSIKKIWRIDGADETHKEHEYITDGTFTLTTVHLHIDRKPRAIVVPETTAVPYDAADGYIDGIYFLDFNTGLDCALDRSIHREIVEKAVKLAYAALQDEKGFQISTVQEQQE